MELFSVSVSSFKEFTDKLKDKFNLKYNIVVKKLDILQVDKYHIISSLRSINDYDNLLVLRISALEQELKVNIYIYIYGEGEREREILV